MSLFSTAIKRNLQGLRPIPDNNIPIFHVRENDYDTDLIILVESEIDNSRILIPCHEFILKQNIEYFNSMFREGTCWTESRAVACISSSKRSKLDTCQEVSIDSVENQSTITCNPDATDVQNEKFYDIVITVEYPKIFGKYIQSIYSQKVEFDTIDEMVKLYKLVDFYQDLTLLEKIELEIENRIGKMSTELCVEIFSFSDKFDKLIVKNIFNFKSGKTVGGDVEAEAAAVCVNPNDEILPNSTPCSSTSNTLTPITSIWTIEKIGKMLSSYKMSKLINLHNDIILKNYFKNQCQCRKNSYKYDIRFLNMIENWIDNKYNRSFDELKQVILSINFRYVPPLGQSVLMGMIMSNPLLVDEIFEGERLFFA